MHSDTHYFSVIMFEAFDLLCYLGIKDSKEWADRRENSDTKYASATAEVRRPGRLAKLAI